MPRLVSVLQSVFICVSSVYNRIIICQGSLLDRYGMVEFKFLSGFTRAQNLRLPGFCLIN